jgi:RimJ/RimL family protein N-acetyltransferase
MTSTDIPPFQNVRSEATAAVAAVTRTAQRANCTAASDTLTLSDGTPLRFRPVDADDRDALAGLFDRLTAESRRMRFFSPKRSLTPRELAFFTDIDHVRHEAIAAVDQRDCSIVGVARYVRSADRALIAEVAIEVADDLHRMGIGFELTKRIARRARANGLTLLTATTLWENRPARALLRKLKFEARAIEGGAIDFAVELARHD